MNPAMLVPLATTLNHPRACIAAGVLEEHGLFAEVWDDASSVVYGPVTSGGYRLMVEEADLAQAQAILNTAAPPVEDAWGPAPPPLLPPPLPPPLSIENCVGTGFLAGALLLPLLVAVVSLGKRVYLVLTSASPEALPPLLGNVSVLYVLNLAISGAFLGALTAIPPWLLSNYRRNGIPGTVFVTLVMLVLVLVCALTGGL
jgi:hypothetical protein